MIMKEALKRIILNRKFLLPFLIVIIVVFFCSVIIPGGVARGASASSFLVDVLIGLILYAIGAMGKLLGVLIDILIKIGGYNDFVDAQMVVIGWQVVRDICNIGFILGLLVIAFGTILRIQTYHYKTTLLKLLLMALLINFSKTIAGIFIDASQVVMMTFFYAIKDAAAGNFVIGFGIEGLLNIRKATGDQEIGNMDILGSVFFGILMIIFAGIIIFIMIMMLLFRIFMLWILVILSPIAYLAQAVPSLKQYGDRWWTTFTKYLTNGPVLAFFLWLSLALVSFNYKENQTSGKATKGTLLPIGVEGEGNKEVDAATQEPAAGVSDSTTSRGIMDYITMCGLLLLSMSLAAESGVMGASMAGTALGKIKSMAKNAATKTATAPWRATKAAAGYAAEVGTAATGINLSPSKWIEAFKANRAHVRETRFAKAEETGAGRKGILGRLGSPKDMFSDVLNAKNMLYSLKAPYTLARGKGFEGAGFLGQLAKEVEWRGRHGLKKKMDAEGDNFEKFFKQNNEDVKKENTDYNTESKAIDEEVSKIEKIDNEVANVGHNISDMNTAGIELRTTGAFNLTGRPEVQETVKLLLQLKENELKAAKYEPAKAKAISEEIRKLESGLATGVLTGLKGTADGDKLQEAFKIKLDGFKQLKSEEGTDDRKAAREMKLQELADKRKALDEKHTARITELEKSKEDMKPKFEEFEKKYTEAQPEELFYAQAAGKELVDHELQKVKHIKDSKQLIAYYHEAVKNKDTYRAQALLQKLGTDYNLNDVMNQTQKPDGTYYGTDDIQELHEFIKNELKDKLGMEEQAAFNFEQELCAIQEGNKQWNLARGIQYQGGKLKQLSTEDQSELVVAEMTKGSTEDIWKGMSRLAIGGERVGADGKYKFELGMVGAKLFSRAWKSTYQPLVSRRNFNQNLAMNLCAEDEKALKFIRQLVLNTTNPDERSVAGTSLEAIFEELSHLGKQQQAGRRNELNSIIESDYMERKKKEGKSKRKT